MSFFIADCWFIFVCLYIHKAIFMFLFSIFLPEDGHLAKIVSRAHKVTWVCLADRLSIKSKHRQVQVSEASFIRTPLYNVNWAYIVTFILPNPSETLECVLRAYQFQKVIPHAWRGWRRGEKGRDRPESFTAQLIRQPNRIASIKSLINFIS